MSPDPAAIVERCYDHAFVVDALLRLAGTPTDVPLGPLRDLVVDRAWRAAGGGDDIPVDGHGLG